MGNWLSQPYCEFDPVEWEEKTDIPISLSPSDTTDDAFSCHHDLNSDNNCNLHRDVSAVTTEEMSNAILKHFQQSTSDPSTQWLYNTVVGVEVPGFSLNGRIFRASQSNEIDIIYLIAHGEVDFAGSDVVSKLGLRSSLFTAGFEAPSVTFSKNVVFNYSRFEQGANFRQALFDKGVSFYDTTIEGDLDLSQTTIHGSLNLQESTVRGNVLLHGSTIKGDLKLEGAEITGELGLKQATVEGAVRAVKTNTETMTLFSTHLVGPWFSKNHEMGSLEWQNSRFESSVILSNCTIHGSFSSSEITMGEGLRWYDTTVEGSVEFIDSQFKHVSSFRQGEVQGSFDVRHSDMQHHFRLIGLDVGEDLVLGGTELGSYTLLHNVETNGDLLAGSANATGVLRFNEVEVGGDAMLTDLAVEEHLEFLTCTFMSDVDLSKSVVHEYIQFRDGTFQSDLVAQNSRVGRNFEMTDCTCSERIDLTGTRIGTLFLDEETVTESLILKKTHVTERAAVLNGITVRQTLSLDNANFNRGLRLASACLGELNMEETEVIGNFLGRELTVGTPTEGGSFLAADAKFSGKLQLEEATINGRLDLQGATVTGEMNTDQLRVTDTFSLSNAHISGNVGGNGTSVIDLNLTGTKFDSSVLFHKATIQGNIDASQVTSIGSNVTFFRSRILGEVSFENADLAGDLIITECKLRGKETDSDIQINNTEIKNSANTPDTTLNARSAVIGGDFLIENSHIRNTVYARGAKPQMVTLDETTITGSYYINETEIGETLTITSTNIFGIVNGADIRLNSKCDINDLTAQAINFDDSLFKWNVTISESLVGKATLENAIFRNELRLREVMVYNDCIYLNRARITDISIIWSVSSADIKCKQANLGNLDATVPEEDRLWDRLHIDRTQFDEFDFTDFTASLSRTNHLIHQDEQRSRLVRYRSFFPTFLQHGIQSLSEDTDDLIKTYEDREVTYRRAKDSADTTGDNPAASKFYMHEKKYRRRRRFWTIFTSNGNRIRNFITWATNLGLGVLAGHGERASQVVVSAIGVIIIFGILLSVISSPTVGGTVFEPATAFEQSLRTFVGAPSAIGQANMSSLVQRLLLVERALGIAFIPLLVFALTRSLRR